MAAPTIHHHSAPSGSGASTLDVWMPKLDDMLVNDAGWERSFVDSDAIGGGSAGAPAWDKTPSTNTDAGIAVYRMPANDHTTRWYVRLRPGWGSQTTGSYMRGITIGTTHDGNGGVTGGNSELTPSTLNHANSNMQHMLSVSEDGFALIIQPNHANFVMSIVERARTLNGTVLDDVIAAMKFGSTVGCHVNASVGQVSADAPLRLMAMSGDLPSLEASDATNVAVIGPYFTGGNPLFAPPRLGFFASPQDVLGDSDRELVIDGGSKTYRAATAAAGASLGIWLAAIE